MTKYTITKRIILYELIGFAVLIFLIIADETLDLPHNVFGLAATPINWSEAAVESIYALGLCIITIYLTLRILNRIKYLEGFLPVCSFCKKIRVGENWIPFETYIKDHSEADFTHGFCPECIEKNYGEFLRGEESKL